MAKNIGLIKISGKVGDLQFFQKDGQTYVGLSSSLSKDRIKKDPAFKRTRENMAEFGGAATVSKAIRQKLIPIAGLIESGLHARFTSILREIMNAGSGARGQRAVQFTANGSDLEGFELNKTTRLGEVMLTTNTIASNTDRNQLVLDVAEFLPDDYLMIPEGATHFKIHLAGLAMSDFEPVGPKNKYKPINAAQHGLFDNTESALLSVDALVTGGVQLTINLPGAPVLTPDVALAAIVGIEFLQEVNGTFYQFASNNAVQILKLF